MYQDPNTEYISQEKQSLLVSEFLFWCFKTLPWIPSQPTNIFFSTNNYKTAHIRVGSKIFWKGNIFHCINPIRLEILRFGAKTMAQIKRKRQGMANKHLLEMIRVNPIPLAWVQNCTLPPISYDFWWKYLEMELEKIWLLVFFWTSLNS